MYRRHTYVVISQTEVVECYGPYQEDWDGSLIISDPSRYRRLDDVLADINAKFEELRLSEAKDLAHDREIGSMDLTVWRDGRIVAVIRRGDDGHAIVTRFD